MRAVFLALVLVNLAFFAWWRFFAPPDAALDAAPMARQVQPESLRILRPDQLPPPKPAAPQPAPQPAPAPAAAPASPATPAPPPLACLEWGSFTLADAPSAEKQLEPLALGARLSQRRTEETAHFWVFMPPQGNRQAALRKAAELKSLGVTDYFIIQEDPALRWALSLGVFRTEEAARNYLAALRTRGVRTAQVGAREMQVPKVWLQVKDADGALQARLREIAKGIEGSELRPCSG